MAEKTSEEILEKLRQGILKKEYEVGRWDQMEEDLIIEVLEMAMETKDD